jgi:hypothetical protein
MQEFNFHLYSNHEHIISHKGYRSVRCSIRNTHALTHTILYIKLKAVLQLCDQRCTLLRVALIGFPHQKTSVLCSLFTRGSENHTGL